MSLLSLPHINSFPHQGLQHYSAQMSVSPPIRRLSTASSQSKRSEDLINAYEAEEEKIINLLSRKLEKVCIKEWFCVTGLS